MATRHHGNLFENVVAKNLEAQIKVKALTEVIASHKKLKKLKSKFQWIKMGKDTIIVEELFKIMLC